MKKTIYIALFGAIAIMGCHGKDELFVDPVTPGNGTPKTQLTEIEVATINSYEGDLARTSGIYTQQLAGTDGQAINTQIYAGTQLEQDNNWSQLYATLKNGKELRDNFGATRPYYDGITQILMAMNFGLLTDMYGDVPATEALNGAGNFYPRFDPQETVLMLIQSMLNDAIVKLGRPVSENAETPDFDLIYGGNIEKWKKAAYTLKARYLNRLSNKAGYNASAILSALNNGIQDAGDDMMGVHGGDNGQNQWYAYQNNRPYYILANQTLVDSMNLRPQDLRLFYYYDTLGFGEIVGSPLSPTTTDASFIGRYLAGDPSNAAGGDPSISTPLITSFEAKFIEAEVKARQNDPSAAAALNAGIQENAIKVTNGIYDGANIATYTAATTNLHSVMYEKWIAMFGQVEVWNDYRRTKIPALMPNPDGAVSVIPERLPISQQERNTNPNAISLPITTPVWWAQ